MAYLSWLWRVCVKPILDGIGLRISTNTAVKACQECGGSEQGSQARCPSMPQETMRAEAAENCYSRIHFVLHAVNQSTSLCTGSGEGYGRRAGWSALCRTPYHDNAIYAKTAW